MENIERIKYIKTTTKLPFMDVYTHIFRIIFTKNIKKIYDKEKIITEHFLEPIEFLDIIDELILPDYFEIKNITSYTIKHINNKTYVYMSQST